ncbi:Crp/Fnr family transcriptional regulator [uncultured Microscilla sp.]|uniref:Crp/Fnr family transcriptional regulator n=1 Tax=uncultured Microscilla sp. TaxID=432653 RepID=UPI002634F6E8|nr:Crp/Fnr family transcriptional regulator [uncultured Microscilla sp.]
MKALEPFYQQMGIREPALRQAIEKHGFVTAHVAQERLIKTGEYIKVLKILLQGRVRVFQESEDREILIYYLSQMETCTLSLSACFGDCQSTVSAIVESNQAQVLNIPVRYVTDWCHQYPSWNHFTIDTFRHSYQVLMESYSMLAFKTLNERLWEYLTNNACPSTNNVVLMSHQQIANELGTTREVVSRLLKKLEKQQRIRLGQKSIQIIYSS